MRKTLSSSTEDEEQIEIALIISQVEYALQDPSVAKEVLGEGEDALNED